VRTTIEIIQLGVPIARVELIDVNTVRMVNAYAQARPCARSRWLLMEFHGSPAGVKEQAETVQELASGHGGKGLRMGQHAPRKRTRLWTAPPTTATFAAVQSRPGCRVISTDTCVADLPGSPTACLNRSPRADASGIPLLPGRPCRRDGNFHFGYLLDPNLPEERVDRREAQPCAGLARPGRSRAPAPASNGVGLHKMDFLVTEAGAGAIDMMRTIKRRASIPRTIMNPGKDLSNLRPCGTDQTNCAAVFALSLN